jgi:hypothetical protein
MGQTLANGLVICTKCSAGALGEKKFPILNSQRMGTTDRYIWRKKAKLYIIYVFLKARVGRLAKSTVKIINC